MTEENKPKPTEIKKEILHGHYLLEVPEDYTAEEIEACATELKQAKDTNKPVILAPGIKVHRVFDTTEPKKKGEIKDEQPNKPADGAGQATGTNEQGQSGTTENKPTGTKEPDKTGEGSTGESK